MPPSDGVSTLNELNAKYQKWVKNSKTRESGSVGSCNADSLYDKTEIADGTSTGSRIHDYYVCGATDGGKCVGLSFSEWDDIWGNCNSLPGNVEYDRDKCINMAVQNTPGVNEFDMGLAAGAEDVYDPVTNSGCNGCSLSDRRGANVANYSALGDTSRYNSGMDYRLLFSTDGVNHWGLEDNCDDCRIGGVEGMRPAFPNNKTGKLTTIGATVGNIDETILCPYGGILSKQLYCTLDGHEALFDDGMGCGLGGDGGLEDLARFCAREKSDYADEKIAQCCLGTLGNGPEVDTKGEPMSDSYKNCPREFCTSRIDEGTVSGAPGIHCDNPVTSKDAGGSQDETFCYEMSKECNQFFTDKCTTAVFSNPQDDDHNPLKTYCTHWGHIQPDSFADKAEAVCDINHGDHDYTSNLPDQGDLDHVKKVVNTPLCRNFITDPDHYARERPKLKNLCQHYMEPNDVTGVWEKNSDLLTTSGDDILANICGCHYPDAFYDWWKTTQENRGVGTCQDSAHITQSQLTQETCEAVTGNTWNTDQNSAMLVSSISEAMKPFPQCYYLPCSSSMLFDKEDSMNPCKVSIQACVNSITQNNMVFDDDGNIEEYPDMTGHAQQTCNQSQLLAPQTPPTTPDDESSGIGSTISSWLGGGSGTDSGTGSGTGGDSTMIIIIIIVIIIIIIGVVAVVMLNKGNPNPPQQIAQQITQQAPVPA